MLNRKSPRPADPVVIDNSEVVGPTPNEEAAPVNPEVIDEPKAVLWRDTPRKSTTIRRDY